MKLFIITINYNNAVGLRKTMESVFSQTYRDFEYIVVDGASTDDSVSVIKEFAKRPITHNLSPITFTWISEPDTGIYNAMNKGIEIALGKRVVDTFNHSTLCGDKHSEADRQEGAGVENKDLNRSELVEDNHSPYTIHHTPSQSCSDHYTLMLNSGDYLVDEHVIERVMPKLDGTDIIQGNVIKVQGGKEIVEPGYGRSDISFIDVMKNHFLHQASFCRIDLFERYGYFDESYKINGDTVFFAKCLGFGNSTFKYIDINIAYYDLTGISADPNKKWKALRYVEDKRYAQMFSQRMWDLYYKEEKKINLYNKLHARKWSWWLTMTIAHLVQIFHREH